MNSFEYLKTSPTRNMPWIRRGLRCNMDGKDGTVTAGAGGYVRIRFDGEKHSHPCHPHWMMTYYNEDGTVLKDYKEKVTNNFDLDPGLHNALTALQSELGMHTLSDIEEA